MERIEAVGASKEQLPTTITMPEKFTDAAREEGLQSIIMQLKNNPSRAWLTNSLYSYMVNRVSGTELKSLEKKIGGEAAAQAYEANLKNVAREAAVQGLPIDNDIGWFSYTGTKDAQRNRTRMNKVIGGKTVEVAISRKEYFTVPVGSGSPEEVLSRVAVFQNALPALAKELSELSIKNGDRISFKVPGNLQYFLKHPDSLVVHYGKEEQSVEIRAIVAKHLSALGMSPTRDNRAETGFDFKSETDLFDGSHSSLMSTVIADRMVRAVKANPALARAKPEDIQAFLDRTGTEVAGYSPAEMLARLEQITTA